MSRLECGRPIALMLALPCLVAGGLGILDRLSRDLMAQTAAEALRPLELPQRGVFKEVPASRPTRSDATTPNHKKEPRPRGDTPAGRLLDKLEAQNANHGFPRDAWCRTLKELVDLGPAAVPELIAELDATDSDAMLRCLGFVLRAIGDRRAVPALIRAIPRTLRPPGSDLGLIAGDAELLKFAQQHDLDERNEGNRYGFGRPVREICGAIQKLTGQKRGEEQLFHCFLQGTARQQQLKRELFQRTAKDWADWWERHWSDYVTDEAYARVDLPEPAAETPVPAPQPGTLFRTNHSGSGWLLESVLNPKSKQVFYDFDTGRVTALPEQWRAGDDIAAHLDEITTWALREGFDLMGTEYVSPTKTQRVYAVQSIGMRVWELGPNRWKMKSKAVTLEELQEEGSRREGLLLHHDPESDVIDPREIGSFLYITREGTPGLLFVGVEVQDDGLKPGGAITGDDELRPIHFWKGRRFGFTILEESKGEGEP